MHGALRVPAHDPVVGNVSEVDIAGGVPGGALGKGDRALKFQLGWIRDLGFQRRKAERQADERKGEPRHGRKLSTRGNNSKQE